MGHVKNMNHFIITDPRHFVPAWELGIFFCCRQGGISIFIFYSTLLLPVKWGGICFLEMEKPHSPLLWKSCPALLRLPSSLAIPTPLLDMPDP